LATNQTASPKNHPDDRRRRLCALARTSGLPGGVSDTVYAEVAKHFDEQELAQLIALIFTVNAWNWMNVTTRSPPGVR
jgi:alkylhydroperoxidase family enzyme